MFDDQLRQLLTALESLNENLCQAESSHQVLSYLETALPKFFPHAWILGIFTHLEEFKIVICGDGSIAIPENSENVLAFAQQWSNLERPLQMNLGDVTPCDLTNQLHRTGVRQLMLIPIQCTKIGVGLITLCFKDKTSFQQHHEIVLKQMGMAIASHLQRLTLVSTAADNRDRHRRYAQRLEVLNEMGQRLSLTMNLSQVFEVIAVAIESLLPTERISYVIPNPERNTFKVLELRGCNALPKTAEYPLENTSIQFMLQRKQATIYSDLSRSPYPEHIIFHQQGLRMAWSIPIQLSDNVQGILNAATSIIYPYPDEILTLLSALGRFMETTLERIHAQNDVTSTLKQLEYQVKHDLLTHVLNRQAFEQLLTHELNALQANIAVLLIDLDGFKQINDSLSHSVGDDLLCAVSDRLQQYLAPRHCIARMGGDEFVILLRDIHNHQQAEAIGNEIINQLEIPFLCQEHPLTISGSVGISLCPQHGTSGHELIKNADIAMYIAKSKGKNRCQVYESWMSERLELRLSYEKALRTAIANQELFLEYQPQISVSSGQVMALEALIRWQHPEQGFVPPDVFIPLAEETGLINDISSWVLDESLKVLSLLRKTYPNLYMSINISAREFSPPLILPHRIQAALTHYNLPGSALELELTESVFLEHPKIANDVIQILKSYGVRLAIDDFGTGFSSLNYLLHLPMDTLKIDRSFVQYIHTDSRTKGIVKTILALGENLNATCVAEGVETVEQVTELQALGCQVMQGYRFAKPMSLRALEVFLDQYQRSNPFRIELCNPESTHCSGTHPI